MEKIILSEMDKAFQYRTPDQLFLEMGAGYEIPLSVRVHLFSDGNRWAAIFEKNLYNTMNLDISTLIFEFGNCLNRRTGRDGFPNYREVIIEVDALEMPIGSENENDHFSIITEELDSIRISGHNLIVDRNPGTYEAMGIYLESDSTGKKQIDYLSMIKLLSETNPNAFYLEDSEIRKTLPSDLPRLMTISEWVHSDDIEPSAQKSYQNMAKVLANANPSLWNSVGGNLSWRDWPEAGGL